MLRLPGITVKPFIIHIPSFCESGERRLIKMWNNSHRMFPTVTFNSSFAAVELWWTVPFRSEYFKTARAKNLQILKMKYTYNDLNHNYHYWKQTWKCLTSAIHVRISAYWSKCISFNLYVHHEYTIDRVFSNFYSL